MDCSPEGHGQFQQNGPLFRVLLLSTQHPQVSSDPALESINELKRQCVVRSPPASCYV